MSVLLDILPSIIVSSKRDEAKDYEKNLIAKHDWAVERVLGGADSDDGRGNPYRSGGTERYNSKKLPCCNIARHTSSRRASLVRSSGINAWLAERSLPMMPAKSPHALTRARINGRCSSRTCFLWKRWINAPSISLSTIQPHFSCARSCLPFWKNRYRMMCWAAWLKRMKPMSWKRKRHPCNREKAKKTQRNRNKMSPFQRENVHLHCYWQG